MGLTTSATLALVGTLTDARDLGTASIPVAFSQNYTWESGTGANQADMIWGDQRTLAASATEDLDLAAVLTHMLTGAVLTFARIKAIAIRAASGNTNAVQVTRPGTNGVPLFMAAGDGIALLPGATFIWMSPNATGVAVTAGTGDLLTITNSAGTTGVTYDILIIGASA